MCKFFGKYKNKFVDFLRRFSSFFTCKISYLRFQTQKNLKVAVHFHICVLQHTKFESYTNNPKSFWQVAKNWRKVDKKFNKAFWKVLTFCYWLYFCVFFQCCTLKFSIGSNFGVKSKKSLFSNCLFCPNLLFLLQHCFSPNLNQW